MDASFFKRVSAYIIDYVFILLILNLISINFSTSYQDEMKNMMDDYSNEKITYVEFYDKYMPLYYESCKETVGYNIISLIIVVGYYVLFQYFNKGQTLGKKLIGIQVVSKNNRNAGIGNILIRGIFLYSIISALLCIALVNILGSKSFTISVLSLQNIEMILFIICGIFVLYKKDNRGLHDVIAGTKVIDLKEVENE